MKNIILTSVFVLFLMNLALQAQVVNPALKALSSNGYLTLQAASTSDVPTLFVQDSTGNITLDFVFGINDVRNGIHTSNTPVVQSSGKVNFTFQNISIPLGVDISFYARQYDPEQDNIRDFFITGGDLLMPPPEGGTAECPVSLSCIYNERIKQWSLVLTFANSLSVKKWKANASEEGLAIYFGPGDPDNNIFQGEQISIGNPNSLYVPLNNCQRINDPGLIITIITNDLVCHYKNGTRVNTNCSIFENYYTPGDGCAALFETCGISLLKILRTNQSNLICRQWDEWKKQACTTTEHIYRTGKVSIGTNKSSNLGILTVKNGIITNKVTIKDCKTGNFPWCDYVFEPGYPLLPLEQLANHIQEKRHLPGMPPAADIEKEGSFELGDITFRQQEKIEELYLYLISLEKELSDLEAELAVIRWLERTQKK